VRKHMNKITARWTSIVSVFVIAISLVISGCSQTPKSTKTPSTSFSGTRLSNYQDGSEKLVLNADGSYKQFIQTKTHRTLTNISHWTPGQPPANSTDTGQWFILHDYVAPWDWVKSKPNAPLQRSTMLISTDGFDGFKRAPPPVVATNTDANGDGVNQSTGYQQSSGTYPSSFGSGYAQQRRNLSPAAFNIALLLGVVFTILWVYAIIGAAQRGDWIWLIIIVLFGVCPSFLYVVLRMFSSSSQRRY